MAPRRASMCELTDAGGDAGLVAEPLVDVEGALIVTGGLVVVLAPVRHDAKPVASVGLVGGPGWQPGRVSGIREVS